jgi:hypothetical protein
MPEIYYEKLREIDQRIDKLAAWRDKKLNKLKKKDARILAKVAQKTEAAMKELGLTIPDEVKEPKNGSR